MLPLSKTADLFVHCAAVGGDDPAVSAAVARFGEVMPAALACVAARDPVPLVVVVDDPLIDSGPPVCTAVAHALGTLLPADHARHATPVLYLRPSSDGGLADLRSQITAHVVDGPAVVVVGYRGRAVRSDPVWAPALWLHAVGMGCAVVFVTTRPFAPELAASLDITTPAATILDATAARSAQALTAVVGEEAQRLATFHGVEFDPAVVAAAVRGPADRMPWLATTRLDQAAVAARLAGRTRVSTEDLAAASPHNLGAGRGGRAVPRSPHHLPSPVELRRALRARVGGQDHVIDELIPQVLAGLRGTRGNGDRPAALVLMVGPPGVGKTELAVALPDAVGATLVRYDFGAAGGEQHLSSVILGSPAGYVGSDDYLTLPKRILAADGPVVVLVDEVDKAHPTSINVLLQMMSPTITDRTGTTAPLRDVLIIATSNTASRAWDRAPVGFTAPDPADVDRAAHAVQAQIRASLSPELYDRFDATLVFRPLAGPGLAQAVDVALTRWLAGLADAGYRLTLTADTRALLTRHAGDGAASVRQVRRHLDQRIGLRLAPLPPGDYTVTIDPDGTDVRIIPGCAAAGG